MFSCTVYTVHDFLAQKVSLVCRLENNITILSCTVISLDNVFISVFIYCLFFYSIIKKTKWLWEQFSKYLIAQHAGLLLLQKNCRKLHCSMCDPSKNISACKTKHLTKCSEAAKIVFLTCHVKQNLPLYML